MTQFLYQYIKEGSQKSRFCSNNFKVADFKEYIPFKMGTVHIHIYQIFIYLSEKLTFQQN